MNDRHRGVEVQRPQTEPLGPNYNHSGQTFQQVPAKLQRRNTKGSGSDNNNKCTNNDFPTKKGKWRKKKLNTEPTTGAVQNPDWTGEGSTHRIVPTVFS